MSKKKQKTSSSGRFSGYVTSPTSSFVSKNTQYAKGRRRDRIRARWNVKVAFSNTLRYMPVPSASRNRPRLSWSTRKTLFDYFGRNVCRRYTDSGDFQKRLWNSIIAKVLQEQRTRKIKRSTADIRLFLVIRERRKTARRDFHTSP